MNVNEGIEIDGKPVGSTEMSDSDFSALVESKMSGKYGEETKVDSSRMTAAQISEQKLAQRLGRNPHMSQYAEVVKQLNATPEEIKRSVTDPGVSYSNKTEEALEFFDLSGKSLAPVEEKLPSVEEMRAKSRAIVEEMRENDPEGFARIDAQKQQASSDRARVLEGEVEEAIGAFYDSEDDNDWMAAVRATAEFMRQAPDQYREHRDASLDSEIDAHHAEHGYPHEVGDDNYVEWDDQASFTHQLDQAARDYIAEVDGIKAQIEVRGRVMRDVAAREEASHDAVKRWARAHGLQSDEQANKRIAAAETYLTEVHGKDDQYLERLRMNDPSEFERVLIMADAWSEASRIESIHDREVRDPLRDAETANVASGLESGLDRLERLMSPPDDGSKFADRVQRRADVLIKRASEKAPARGAKGFKRAIIDADKQITVDEGYTDNRGRKVSADRAFDSMSGSREARDEARRDAAVNRMKLGI